MSHRMSPSSKGLCINLKNQTDLSVGVTYITRLQVPLFLPSAGAGSALAFSCLESLLSGPSHHSSSRKQLFFALLNELKGVSGLRDLAGAWDRVSVSSSQSSPSVRRSSGGVFDAGLTACRRDFFVSSGKVATHPLHRTRFPWFHGTKGS